MGSIFPYRIRFEKTGKLRFLSHHDLMRLFERAVRRSGIPVRMTEGFNPRPVLSFPTALGIGIESADEVMGVELSAWAAPKQVRERLAAQLPEEVRIRSVEPHLRKDRARVAFAEYEVDAPGQTEGLRERIGAFLDLEKLVVTRDLGNRKKEVDIRPYVMDVETDGDRVLLRIEVTDRGSARPEEVLAAVGVEMRDDVRIRKTYTEVQTR
jgi:radical SAM-linked protein